MHWSAKEVLTCFSKRRFWLLMTIKTILGRLVTEGFFSQLLKLEPPNPTDRETILDLGTVVEF